MREGNGPTFNEIERGFYFGIYGGLFAVISPPASAKSSQPFSLGQSGAVEIGYDIVERLSLGIFFMATGNRANSDYLGIDKSTGAETGLASGDFVSYVPGANVRINIVGFEDSQEVKRLWIYARAGAGLMFSYPKALLPDMNLLVFAGPGVEYFTRLRHFSIGVDATFTLMPLVPSSAPHMGLPLGFAITPNLRYAF